MPRHYFEDPTDAPFDEFETRRRISAVEYDLDRRWEERPRRPRRPRRLWRRDADEWR